MVEKTTDKIIGELRKLTGKRNIYLAKRGNASILASLECAKKLGKNTVLMQDQGGWITYPQYSRELGMEAIELKTDYGVILLPELESALKKRKNAILMLHSCAGYNAAQPMDEIAALCEKHGCFLINDATSTISKKELLKGDIILASFGPAKPINLGKGGFIAADFEIQAKTNPIDATEEENKELLEKITNLSQRMEFLLSARKKVIDGLKGFDIVKKGSWGINVIVKYKSEEEKRSITGYCEKNKLEYVLCPRYIRIKENAVSI